MTRLSKGHSRLRLLALLAQDLEDSYPFHLAQRAGLPLGTVYTALCRLESQGFVFSEVYMDGKVRRRYYSITPAGRDELLSAMPRSK